MDGDKMVEKRKIGNDVVVTNYEVKDGLLVGVSNDYLLETYSF